MRDVLPSDLYGPWYCDPLWLAGNCPLPWRGNEAPVPAPHSAPPAFESVAGAGGRSVAIVRAVGPLVKGRSWFGTSTIQMREGIQAAAADNSVSSILLAIESPGGTVAGLADVVAEIRAARRQKPVVAQIEDLGASAAYQLASQADAVYANSPDALVGSIGTIMVVYDFSAAAEMEGVRPVVFATGPLKGAGTPGTPVTGEQQAYFQGIIDGMQQSFDDAVMKGRGMDRQQLAAVKTGGVFLAREAKGLGLIDGIRPLKATLSAMLAQK